MVSGFQMEILYTTYMSAKFHYGDTVTTYKKITRRRRWFCSVVASCSTKSEHEMLGVELRGKWMRKGRGDGRKLV